MTLSYLEYDMTEIKTILGAKGQIVIPKVFRDEFNLAPGKEVILKEVEEGILIKKRTKDLLQFMEELAEEATKIRGGKEMEFDVHEIYKQYEERNA